MLETLTLEQSFFFLAMNIFFFHTSLQMGGCKRKGNREALVLQHP